MIRDTSSIFYQYSETAILSLVGVFIKSLLLPFLPFFPLPFSLFGLLVRGDGESAFSPLVLENSILLEGESAA